MKTLILATWKGTRIRPLTDVLPKRLIPKLGRPDRELRAHPRIEQCLCDARSLGVDMAYAYEGAVATVGETIHAPPGARSTGRAGSRQRRNPSPRSVLRSATARALHGGHRSVSRIARRARCSATARGRASMSIGFDI